MTIPKAERLKEELMETNPRFVISIGNWEDEVVLYVQYQAGSSNDYLYLPEIYKGIRIIKDGLFKKCYG